ncbi:MAG: MjaI family restriction endonuclease [Chitinophagales bacterium]
MLFELNMNPAKFRATNAVWNELHLNDPWSVGYVATLIEEQTFAAKEDWQNYYYASGEKRQTGLLQLDTALQNTLQNSLLKYENPAAIYQIPLPHRQLNTQFGRTKADFEAKAKILQSHCNIELTTEEALECVRFRVICETWNGIIVRERATVQTLQKHFPKIEFKVSDGVRDYQYAIDYELFLNGKLLGAIQIKPKSYQGNQSYLQKAKNANSRKHQAYFNTYNRNVRYIFANHRGEILNTDDFLEKLKKYYEKYTR